MWSGITLSEPARVNEELVYYGEELDSALVYLELFAPDTEKQEFESRISALFENKWMVDLIDTAMAKIYDYHNNGRLYHEIISKSYLTAFRYTGSELLDLLNMRSAVPFTTGNGKRFCFSAYPCGDMRFRASKEFLI